MAYQPKSVNAKVYQGASPLSPNDILRERDAIMAARGYSTPDVSKTLMMLGAVSAGTATETQAARVNAALEALAQFEADLAYTLQLNAFNAALAAYRKATARLARVRLSTGADAVYEDQPTGEYDEQGQPITESVLISPAVEPLVAKDVEYPVYDEEGHQTGTVTEPDRDVTARIEKDEAERAAAQAVIEGTPQEVKEYDF